MRYWWDDLGDDELRARLAQRATNETAELLVAALVRHRGEVEYRRIIAVVLGD